MGVREEMLFESVVWALPLYCKCSGFHHSPWACLARSFVLSRGDFVSLATRLVI